MKANDIKEFVGLNKIFGAKFIKKDGTERKGTFRLRVRKGLTGAGMRYNPIERNLLSVWDLRKNGYRMIDCENVQEIRAHGVIIYGK